MNNISKNATFLFLSQIISYIIGFLYLVYSARYLGAENFGIISFALAFCGLFALLMDLGFNTLTTREVSRNRSLANKFLGNILVIKILLALITLLAVAIAIDIFEYSYLTSFCIYLITFYVMVNSFTSSINSIFQAYEKMEYQAVGQVLTSSLILLGVIIAIRLNYGVIEFAAIYFISSLVTFIYTIFILIWKFFTPKLEFDKKFWKTTIKESIPISASSLLSILYYRIDIVILSFIQGNLVVGWYSASYKLIDVFLFIPSVFSFVMLPFFSKMHISPEESLENSYKKSVKFLLVISLPICVIITLLANKIIMFIFGINYSESVIALQILIWTIPLVFLTWIFGTIFVSINKQNLLVKLFLIATITNIIFNLILIPLFSYIGAAFATVFTEFILFLMGLHYLSKLICKIPFSEYLYKIIISCLFIGLFIYFSNLNLFLVIFISIVIYIVVLILLKTFSNEELMLFKNLLNNN